MKSLMALRILMQILTFFIGVGRSKRWSFQKDHLFDTLDQAEIQHT